MGATKTVLSSIGRRRGVAASATLVLGVVLAHSACYEFAEVERPVGTGLAARRVQISRVVPEGCTEMGEVSGTGTATDDPSEAAERARDTIRSRAAAIGANYVMLEMQTGGPTRTEGLTVGTGGGGGLFLSGTSVSSDLEVALWGRAFSCPEATNLPAENAPCIVHDDCPPQQFCGPSGRCRRP